MKVVFTIASWAGFGVAMSYAVAWCFAVWGSPDVMSVGGVPFYDWTERKVEVPYEWPVVLEEWPRLHELNEKVRVYVTCHEAFGVTLITIGDIEMYREVTPLDIAMFETRHGWPWRATRQVATWQVEPNQPPPSWHRSHAPLSVYHTGVDLGFKDRAWSLQGYPNTHHLGVRPYWPGLLANSAIYASLGALSVHGGPWLRAAARRRRGLCERCGYAMLTLARCPECGVDQPRQ